MTGTCTWRSRLGPHPWRPCTGDHAGGVHHFAGTDRTLPVAETDIAEQDRLTRPAHPSGAGLRVEDVLARFGLAGEDGSDG